VSKIVVGAPDWMETHTKLYLGTDGAEGHFVDFSIAGGSKTTPCLLLKTKGRKSGEARLLPLIYGRDGKDVILIASKGGAPADPAWYLNLVADPEVEIQIENKKWRGRARTVTGPDHDRIYAMMSKIYPPYIEYQAKTDRRIPVVAIEPQAEIARL
jgi:deazaflavin-dependent oxidoreductase (nitroreductase family)